jgi:hypothetical protein
MPDPTPPNPVVAAMLSLNPPPQQSRSKLLHAAWLAILLGVIMELAAWIIGHYPSQRLFLDDLVEKVSWSFVVCCTLTAAAGIANSRAAWMGFTGLLAAPAAFVLAQSLNNLINLNAEHPPLIITVLLLKGIEYGVLGSSIGSLSRFSGGLKSYLLIGFLTGLIFGSAVTGATYFLSAAHPLAPKLVSLAANELLFPIGCTLVLFISNASGQKMRSKSMMMMS